MKDIGVVICNFNKKEKVLECIQSVLESNVNNYDIYVVDNASTDGSSEAIIEKFKSEVTLLQNSENLGGSGGFNTGLRVVLDKGYKYFMCLDDDALVDEAALKNLYEFMENNQDVGMAGARVYHLQMPDYIQQCGIKLDFSNASAKTLYADTLEDGSLMDVIECDAVATCALMIRGDVIRNTDVGIMPEDNFIYWDDMEWSHRMKMAGYRIVTLGTAKALHQMGANVKKPTTFLNYYMWRNRTYFFMKYTPKELMENMSISVLGQVFDSMYESMFRDEHNNMRTISDAFYDAMDGVRGKAADGIIRENDSNDNKLMEYLADKDSYYIDEDGMAEDAFYLRKFISTRFPEMKETQKESAKVKFHMCDFIMSVNDFSRKEIYIDGDRNALITDEDVEIVKNYSYSKMLFIYMNQDAFIRKCKNLL